MSLVNIFSNCSEKITKVGQYSLPATYHRVVLQKEEKEVLNQLTLLLDLLRSHHFPDSKTVTINSLELEECTIDV